MGASYGSAYPAGGYGSSMMSGYGSGSAGTSVGVIAAIVFGALVLLAVIVFFVTRRTPRRPTRPRTA
jgi:uncharacterized membrane protein